MMSLSLKFVNHKIPQTYFQPSIPFTSQPTIPIYFPALFLSLSLFNFLINAFCGPLFFFNS